jgi:LysR family cys regulon transcriptional activator
LRGSLGSNSKNPEVNLREMVSFYHVVRLRSVTKAARFIGVGQNTVSQHLLRLEQEYKVNVFQRPENQMIQRMIQPPTLTAKGEGLLELMTPIVEGASILDESMRRLKQEAPLSIGAYPELVTDRLPSVIKDFHSQHPEVHFRICSSTHLAMIQQVKRGQLDLVIGVGNQNADDDLDYEALFNSRVVLLVPHGHTLAFNPFPTIEDIAEWPIVFSSTEATVRSRAEKSFRDKQCSLQIAVDVDGANIVEQLVALATGIAICADFTVSVLDHRNFDVIPLDHLFDGLTVGLWTLKDQVMNQSTQNFIASLRRELSDEPVPVGAVATNENNDPEQQPLSELARGALAD